MSGRRVVFWGFVLLVLYLVYRFFLKGNMGG
jgi:hypothetical protein